MCRCHRRNQRALEGPPQLTGVKPKTVREKLPAVGRPRPAGGGAQEPGGGGGSSRKESRLVQLTWWGEASPGSCGPAPHTRGHPTHS